MVTVQKIDEKAWKAIRLTEIFDTISRGKRIKNQIKFLAIFRMFRQLRLQTEQMVIVAMKKTSENLATVSLSQIAEVLGFASIILITLLLVTM